MKGFLIAGKVKFLTSENKLCSLDSGEEIELSLVSSHLFSLIIELRGEVTSRERIFTEVFDKFGANKTNNNLNQYILNIRKSLEYLGLTEEVIKTVPKFGFTTSDLILIECIDKTESVKHDEIKKVFPNFLSVALLIIMSSVLCFCVLISIQLDNIKWENINKLEATSSITLGSCVYHVISIDGRTNGKYLDDVIRYTTSQPNLICDDSTSFYIYINYNDQHHHSYFIMKCSKVVEASQDCITQYVSGRYG